MSDQKTDPIFPPIKQDMEATDSNPVPLSPTDPKRRTNEGDTDPHNQAGTGVVRALVAPLTQAGVRGAGTPTPGDARSTSDEDVVRPDSEGAV